ncbi:MAG: hypothetical protein JNK35_00905 [Phycisphaerae bacterium]|nr:hypothetical protein [Phycisphaerae bacterium]
MRMPSGKREARMWVRACAGAVCVAAAGGAAALGQEEMMQPPAEAQKPQGPGTRTPGHGAPEGPLSGPAVRDPRVGVTLVDRDLSGNVRRLDVTPIEAALRLLRLDEQTRAGVEKALLARARLLDDVVAEHLGLLARVAGATQAGRRDEAMKLLRELAEAAPALKDLSALQGDVHAVLPTPQRDELIRLTQDYWNAIIEEAEARAKASGKEFKPGETRELMRREFLAIAAQEVRRAYDRVVGQKVRDFEGLLKALNLTPEQEGRIRQIVGDAFQRNEGRPRMDETARIITQVYRALEPEQREILVERLREEVRARREAQKAGREEREGGRGPEPMMKPEDGK